jgi:hypothetical protein
MYKKKYGKEDKQNLLPPSYLRKRGGSKSAEKAGRFKGLDKVKKNSEGADPITLSQLEAQSPISQKNGEIAIN